MFVSRDLVRSFYFATLFNNLTITVKIARIKIFQGSVTYKDERLKSFDAAVLVEVIEHLDEVVKVVEEIYRIAKNGAKVFITTSHFTSVDSFTDPTHKHFFTSSTFDYFIPGAPLYKYGYSKARFKKCQLWVGPESNNVLLQLILKIINRYVLIYEKRFAFIFPVGCISYELEVVK